MPTHSANLPTNTSKFVQIEDSLLHYLSDQWPSAYAELLKMAAQEYPAQEIAEPGYAWLEKRLLAHLKDQWPSAEQAMMGRAMKEPAILEFN